VGKVDRLLRRLRSRRSQLLFGKKEKRTSSGMGKVTQKLIKTNHETIKDKEGICSLAKGDSKGKRGQSGETT